MALIILALLAFVIYYYRDAIRNAISNSILSFIISAVIGLVTLLVTGILNFIMLFSLIFERPGAEKKKRQPAEPQNSPEPHGQSSSIRPVVPSIFARLQWKIRAFFCSVSGFFARIGIMLRGRTKR